MFFSSALDYGLILLVALRERYLSVGKNHFVNLKTISKENNLPHSYIERLAQKLAKAGLISAKKGQNGGYALAKRPSKISVLEVLGAIEKQNLTYCAYLKQRKIICRVGKCCPTKAGLAKMEQKIIRVLKNATLDKI